MVPRYRVGDRRLVIGNRGLAGIDGCVSTAVGAALGRPRSSRAFALLGDVTFLHDANGLVLGPDEPRPDLMIVVVNDDGGSIFALLEQGDPSYAGSYERIFGTPHHVDLASLCAATRTPHWRVDSLPGAAAGAGLPERRHRGRRGRRRPGRQARARRGDPRPVRLRLPGAASAGPGGRALRRATDDHSDGQARRTGTVRPFQPRRLPVRVVARPTSVRNR